MATYSELVKQIEELQRKAEDARKTELSAAISEVKALIEKFGLTASDLGLGGSSSGGGRAVTKSRKKVAAKYRHPSSGQEWTGRGRTPSWLDEEVKSGKKKEDFLIA